MSICIDTNQATDALAKILYELMDLGVGGGCLANAAHEVETLFRRTNYDFGKWTLEKLEENRINCDYDTVRNMYRALRRITLMKDLPCAEVNDAVKIAEEAMKKARGENE